MAGVRTLEIETVDTGLVPMTPGRHMSTKSLTCGVVFALTLYGGQAVAGPIFYGPTAYSSTADSPFNTSSYEYLFFETFEDGLNTPGVTASGGLTIGWDRFVDSVDADDGTLDGMGGASGHSWYSNGAHVVTFTFNPLVLGGLPTDVGIVWTDIGYNAPTSYWGPVTFEAFGFDGTSLGLLGPFLFGDGFDTGQTAEDRFLGVSDARGISAIRVGTNNGDWEVDHLQYGAQVPQPVPEPSTLLLLGIGAVGLIRSRSLRSGPGQAD
jgi:hypothetical protein